MKNIVKNYQESVLKGFGWQGLLKLSYVLLAAIKIFFLSRLLDPTEFGIFSLVAIGLGVSEAITQTGINITILQTKNDAKHLIDTAWVIAIFRGFIIALITIAISLIMSYLFNMKILIMLGFLAAIVPIIKGFINPSIALWQKNFLFRKEYFYQTLKQATEVFFTVLLAIWWQNVAVFILGMIISALGEVFFSFLLAKPRPKFTYDKTAAAIIWQNAKGLSITATLSYLIENVDDLILGKILGTYQLGLYHNGYNVAHKIAYEPVKAANHSLLAAYTRLTHDHQRLKRGFLKALFLLSMGSLIIGTLVVYFKHPIITLGLGVKWLELESILPWLVLAAIAQGLTAFFYTFWVGLKNYKWINIHLTASLLTVGFSIWFFANKSGLTGAVEALAFTRLLMLLPLTIGSFLFIQKTKNVHSQ